MKWLSIFLSIAFFSPLLRAQDHEGSARRIEALLMAPCCWGSTVAEHSSAEALEIKDGIRSMLTTGKSEAQILSFYEAKFGERILARPKATGFNLLVWILPLFVLLIGGVLTWIFLIRNRAKTGAKPLVASPAISKEDEKYRAEIDKELYGT